MKIFKVLVSSTLKFVLVNTKLINDHTTLMCEEVFEFYPYIRLVHLNDNLIIIVLFCCSASNLCNSYLNFTTKKLYHALKGPFYMEGSLRDENNENINSK